MKTKLTGRAGVQVRRGKNPRQGENLDKTENKTHSTTRNKQNPQDTPAGRRTYHYKLLIYGDYGFIMLYATLCHKYWMDSPWDPKMSSTRRHVPSVVSSMASPPWATSDSEVSAIGFSARYGVKKTSKKWDWSRTGGGFWMMFDWFCYGVVVSFHFSFDSWWRA